MRLSVLLVAVALCALASAADLAQPAGPLAALAAAQKDYDSRQNSLAQALGALDQVRAEKQRAEKTVSNLEASIAHHQDQLTKAKQAVTAAVAAIDKANSAVKTHEANVVAPLAKSIAQQEADKAKTWTVEVNKVNQARAKLPNFPDDARPAAAKRLDDYEKQFTTKIAKLDHDKKTMASHVLTTNTLKQAVKSAHSIHQSRVGHVKALEQKIQQLQVDLKNARSNVSTLHQKDNAALHVANMMKSQLATSAAALKTALDVVIKNSNSEVAQAVRQEHDAFQQYSGAKHTVDTYRSNVTVTGQGLDHLKQRLHKARQHLSVSSDKLASAEQRHRLSRENVYQRQQALSRAQSALDQFKRLHGPVPTTSAGSNPVVVLAPASTNSTATVKK